MTATGPRPGEPPGPIRLFTVSPSMLDPYVVRDHNARHITDHGDVFAAVLTAATTAAAQSPLPVWVIRPDRWHASITATDLGWHLDGSPTAPLDAIRRVLTNHAQGANS